MTRRGQASEFTIGVEILGHLSVVRNAPARVFRDALECPVTRFAAGGPLGCQQTRALERYWQVDEAGEVRVPTGLLPTLLDAVRRFGLNVQVSDRRQFEHDPTGGADAAALLGDALADALVANPRGVIEVRNFADAVVAAGGAALLYPTARLLVAVQSRKQVWQAGRLLRPLVGDGVGLGHDQDAVGLARVLVVTPYQLACANGDDFPLVVATNADAVTRSPARDGMIGLGGGRVYGCVAAGWNPGRRDRLRVGACCGPVIHRAVADAGTAAVRVQAVIPPWSPPVREADPLARKRARCHDPVRNAFLAELALALAAPGENQLAGFGLAGTDPLPPDPTRPGPRVAVLVELVEHGEVLRPRLPRWPLVTAHSAPGPLPARSIVTLAAAARLAIVDVDVLVRADGGVGPLALAGFPPRRAFPTSVVRLVDLVDDADKPARRATAARFAAYERLGWPVAGKPAWAGSPPARRGRRG